MENSNAQTLMVAQTIYKNLIHDESDAIEECAKLVFTAVGENCLFLLQKVSNLLSKVALYSLFFRAS